MSDSALRTRSSLSGLAAAALLAACQATPPAASTSHSPAFTDAQRSTLEREGFERDGNNYELGLENRLLFDFDRSDLKSETRAMLTRLGRVLAEVGIRSAGVEGHADAEGTQAYNQALSLKRADVVRASLAAAGMDDGRMRSWGVGESDPVASNATRQGRRENRRVVIVITPDDAVLRQ